MSNTRIAILVFISVVLAAVCELSHGWFAVGAALSIAALLTYISQSQRWGKAGAATFIGVLALTMVLLIWGQPLGPILFAGFMASAAAHILATLFQWR